MRAITLTLLVVFACAAVLYGHWRGRLVPTSLRAAAVVGVVSLAVMLALFNGWRDADGSFDCHPSCTRFQDAVAVLFIFGPTAVFLLVLTAIVALLLRRKETVRR